MIDIYEIELDKNSYDSDYKYIYDKVFINWIKLFMEDHIIEKKWDIYEITHNNEVRLINKKHLTIKNAYEMI